MKFYLIFFVFFFRKYIMNVLSDVFRLFRIIWTEIFIVTDSVMR